MPSELAEEEEEMVSAEGGTDVTGVVVSMGECGVLESIGVCVRDPFRTATFFD